MKESAVYRRDAFGNIAPQRTYMRGQPRSSKTVAVCHYNRHNGRLSRKMMKEHGCLAKQCPHFEKIGDHPYWKQREHIKMLKRQKRMQELLSDRRYEDVADYIAGLLFQAESEAKEA